ncbi:hypothetical protein QTP88_022144 [Uroleucon formosanum]
MTAPPTDDGSTKSLLADIVSEMKALRHEVSNIRAAQGLSGGEDVNGGTWVDVLLKKIRGGVNREVIDDHIVGMRQTKAGSLLIELKGDQQQIKAVRVEVSRSAGENVEVKSLQQKAMVEIRDLDQLTDGEEVASAVAAEIGVNRDALKVVNVRKRFGGTQMALVTVPPAACQKMPANGRIRVGLVNCRVKLGNPKVRCFRCLSFRHMSKGCEDPDRSYCCRRCGGIGHKAAVCSAPASAVSDFARTIETADKYRT